MKISEKISYLRKRKKLSQEQLAIKLDVSRQAVYKWEADISQPEIDKIKKLALVFDVSYDFLLDDSLDISFLEQNQESVNQNKTEENPPIQNENVNDEPDKRSFEEQEPLCTQDFVEQGAPENAPAPSTPPEPKSKKKKIALMICGICLAGIIFTSSFIISMVNLLTSDYFAALFGNESNSSTSVEKVTVKFKLPDGTVISTQKIEKGKSPSIPQSPSVQGYEFNGWFVDDEYFSSTTTVNSDTDVVAYLRPIVYNIVYKLNEGKNPSSAKTYYNIESDNVYLPTPTRTGHKFLGWYLDSEYENKVESIPSGSIGDKVFYAKWECIQYSISYYLNGGTNDLSNPTSYTVHDTLTLKEPTQNGYTFGGWYLDSSFKNRVTKLNNTSGGDVILYAKWTMSGFEFEKAWDYYIISKCNSDINLTVSLPTSFLGLPVLGIGTGAFYDLSITSITIPNGYTTIYEGAFDSCSALTKVTIPASVTSIAKNAFVNCVSLNEFSVSSQNTSYSSVNGILYNNAQTRLLRYPQGRGGEITLPSTTNFIEAYAFYGCSTITKITFPQRVGGIDVSAFENCTSLVSIDTGTELNYIAHRAFNGCTSLKSITLPKNLSSIGNYAFENCTSLTSFEASCGVDVFGYAVFKNCIELQSVDLGGICYEISSDVFKNCVKLESFIVPNGVVKIGSEAFLGCSALKTVILRSDGIWSVAPFSGTSQNLDNAVISNPETAAEYLKNTYAKYTWSFVELDSSDTESMVTITYNAGIGTVNKQSVEVESGSIYPYHPTPTCDVENKLFNGWFLDQAFTKPAEKYTVFTKSTTLYAKWISNSPCLDGTYAHSWGSMETISKGTCQSPEKLTRTCIECAFKISSYGDRNISNHTNRTEPYVENFRLVIYCYGCDTKMQSEQFENITTSSIKEINISGDVFGAQNLNYMINGSWDEQSTHSIAPKGTSDVTINIEIDGACTVDYIFVKGKGDASFSVFVKYENESDYSFIGAGEFLSSEENSSADRVIPYADVADSGTKKIESVKITITGDSNDYLEEIGLFYIERAN